MSITVLDSRVSKLEEDGTRHKANLQALNTISTQLALDILSANELIIAQQTSISHLEQARTVDRTDIVALNTTVIDLVHQRASDRDFLEQLNYTITIIQANLSSHADAVDYNALKLINAETELELIHDIIHNVSKRVAVLHSSMQLNSSTTESSTQLEIYFNTTYNLMETLDARLSNLEGNHF